ncbi:lysophospholipid transporter LplT [Paucibacter sp. XJ19-41]|uniref:lysophospholipid transporter LplT n=1 Tax=Paucibacter sp. XJ19-41 TaxID=2927824 RepID=UPI002348FA39|nr:lysophospholipid transporter LplT [Paucibacter sp. XJ19-41]MDC6166492.1 lysophospholipid transporter LplT [Paucibacter sp. XJ19-41]
MRMPPGFHLLIAAQFASALADNALLIVTIALLHEQGLPAWWAPLLKFSFTISYVLLAPWVGPLADALPKARLMAWMNGVKMLGLVALLAGLHPVAAYAVVGLGAACYAPAKYGLVTELVAPRQLVAANSWLEVSIVGAALLGTVLGGALVSEGLRALLASLVALPGLASSLSASLALLLLLYGLAAVAQLGVPDSGARYARSASLRPVALLRDFVRANRALWRDAEGGVSLAVTTLFWGVGATLQFAVLRWAQQVLQLGLDRSAYLQAVVAVGVVVGAAAAGRWVPLTRALRVLPLGVLLGLLMAGLAWVDAFALALPLLALVGAVGGLLVVPMNALLQHRGYQLLTAGRSIAVQGFNENLSILGMLALYAGALALDAPLLPLMTVFGSLIALVMLALMRWRRASIGLQQPG